MKAGCCCWWVWLSNQRRLRKWRKLLRNYDAVARPDTDVIIKIAKNHRT